MPRSRRTTLRKLVWAKGDSDLFHRELKKCWTTTRSPPGTHQNDREERRKQHLDIGGDLERQESIDHDQFEFTGVEKVPKNPCERN